MVRTLRLFLASVVGAIVALAVAPGEARAQAEFVRLLPKLPESTNAISLVDLKSLFNTPLALKEKWLERNEGNPLFPPTLALGADYLIYGTAINYGDGFERSWEVVLAASKTPRTALEIAKNQGGAVDNLAGTDVVWSPRDAFIVVFSPRDIGARFPADRQETARWIRAVGSPDAKPTISPYLRKIASTKQGFDHQIVMAFDMADLFSPQLVRSAVATSTAFDLKLDNLDEVSDAVATIEGVLLAINVDTSIEGIVRVDFGGSTKAVERIAKPLLLDVMTRMGAELSDMKDWRVKIEEKTVTLQGPLTTSGARRLVSLLELDGGVSVPEPETAAPVAATEGASPGLTAPTLAATQKYYRDLMTLIDDIKADKAKSQRTLSLWCDRYATKIDRMPILRVDQELLDFSRRITVTLRDLSNTGTGANMNIIARQTTDAASSVGGYGGYYGFGYGPYLQGTSRLAMERITKQEGIKASAYEIQVWSAIEQAVNDLDRSLTMRYGVEF
jgi:hypothetical protein